ncbi:MAG: PPC domain-containing protein [Fuerstiella sp.]
MKQPVTGVPNAQALKNTSPDKVRLRPLFLRILNAIAGCIVAFAFNASSIVVAADAPKIERISPPGGQRGTAVTCKLIGKAGDGQLHVADDATGLTFQISEKQDTITVTIADDATAGLNWIRFWNEAGATELLPFVVGLLPESAEAEPNNDIGAANAVEIPTTINAVLEKSGDVDLYSVTLKAGQTLFSSVTANQQLGSPMDAVLQVVDVAGTTVAHNDDSDGLDPQLTFTAQDDGNYYVRIFAFPSAPNSTIALAGGSGFVYRLTLSTGPIAEFSVPGFVQTGASTDVRIFGTNLPDEGLGATVPATNDAAYDFLTGTDLPLIIRRQPHSSFTEANLSGNSLTMPTSVTGIISQPYEIDRYVLNGMKGQKIDVEVNARSLKSPLDPLITITDASKKLLKEADDRSKENLDAFVQATLPADGLYEIAVSDRYLHGGPRYFYTLTCRPTVPEVSAEVTTSAFVLNADKPLEIPVSISRKNWFDSKLNFTVSGLPEGVDAATVVSEKDGDTSKKVTIKITQTEAATAFSGPIQIIARPDEGETEIAVQHDIPNSSDTSHKHWLTVVPNTDNSLPNE